MSEKKYGAPPPEPEFYPTQELDPRPLRERPSYTMGWCDACKANTKHVGEGGLFFCGETHPIIIGDNMQSAVPVSPGYVPLNDSLVAKGREGHPGYYPGTIADRNAKPIEPGPIVGVAMNEPQPSGEKARRSLVRHGISQLREALGYFEEALNRYESFFEDSPEPERTKND